MDSDNDLDYVPSASCQSDSSDDDGVPQIETSQEQDTANKKYQSATAIITFKFITFPSHRTKEELWAEFQASLISKKPEEPQQRLMVKIEKQYLFAGEQVM